MEQAFSKWNCWRVIGLGLSFLWGCYLVAWGRTQVFGSSWRSLVADGFSVLVFVGPLVALSAIGLPWRVFRRSFVIIGVSAILFAEAYAIAQERLAMRRYGIRPSETMRIQRWPPFQNHQIGFVPGYGWIADD